MSTANGIQGVIGYLISPYSSEATGIDKNALRATIDHLIEGGVHGIAPLGSTGENAYLSDEEWLQVAQTTTSHVNGRVPTVVGVSALTTAKTVQFAKAAEDAGADAVMVLPISYWSLKDDEVRAHYEAVSDAISIPIMAYNNPATAGVDMSPQLLVQMAQELENVSMIKESSGDIQRMHLIQELSGGELPFFNGCNPLALEALAAGARGWCTAAPNLIAGLNVRLWDLITEGELEEARACFYKQLPTLRFILEGGLPTTIKAALCLQGIEVGAPRPPLSALGEEGTAKLKALMSTSG